MANYDHFYRHYDSVMGDPIETADYLKFLIDKHNPKAQSVLELACGTGAVLKHFTSDFETYGLDLSKGMLSVAKKKLAKTHFYHQDMTTFEIGREFDVVFCVYDSINHLTKFGEWSKVFARVASHLKEKGIFIFDINTQYKLQSLSEAPAWVKEFNGNYLFVDVKAEKGGLTSWKIKVFEKRNKNTFTFYHENIHEASFPVTRIMGELKRRFRKITLTDDKSKKFKSTSNRALFLCQI